MLQVTQRSHLTFSRSRSVRQEGFGDAALLPRPEESGTALICGWSWLVSQHLGTGVLLWPLSEGPTMKFDTRDDAR